ncbi:MAG: endonuclease/exonuclease/phosphatase family protein [Clostridia bacterium]|nr:endonuclease/exonuclease/phosphatase family protein [Clostridia bacterium]
MKLKIMTQNVMCWQTEGGEHPVRRERMKRLFARLDPDLIGAQEVTDRWRDYLEEDLPGFGSVFRFRGEDDHEATPLYYKKDRFEAVGEGVFWLSETPEKESFGPGAGCLRTAIWAILKEKASGERLLFVNTHLDHRSNEARILGARLLRDLITSHGDIPAILTGDFNDTSFSDAVKTVKEFMNDSRLAAKETTETNTHASKYGGTADASIDYVFVRGLAPTRCSVEKECDGPYAQSDHYAVFVEAETCKDGGISPAVQEHIR